MSLIDCIDETHKNMVDLLGTSNSLFNPNLFVNPQNSMITGLLGAMQGNKAGLVEAILMSSGNTASRQQLTDLYFKIYGLVQGDTGVPAFNSLTGQMQCYQDWTNFLSCQSTNFPTTLMPVVAGLPQGTQVAAALGTMTFAGILGATAGAKTTKASLCDRAALNDPCAGVSRVFGAILGAFNAVLTAITKGLQLMTDFLAKVGEYLTLVEQWIQQVLDFIADAIASLLNDLMLTIRNGLSKLLSNLNLDPCFSAVIQSIGTTVLLDAIPVIANPSTPPEFPDFPVP